MTPQAVVWHPAERSVFLLAVQGTESIIAKISEAKPEWKLAVIHRSKARLRRLVVGPRPFLVDLDLARSDNLAPRYRVFFGMAAPGGAWATHSITEDGKREYQLAGPKETRTSVNGDPGQEKARNFEVPSALPLSFHPAGHILLWENGKKDFEAAHYDEQNWGESVPLFGGKLTGGTVTALPNGLGVLHWKPGTPGATAVMDSGRTSIPVAPGTSFVSTPSLMPDGKGVVGLTRETKDGPETLRFLPISLPLADVVNAWMFTEDGSDTTLLDKKGGLFRRYGGEQLFQLYESELYSCGGYGARTPTRPYLVTTDALWEVWAAAYEGLFILRERQEAIPAFWAFVDAAAIELEKSAPNSSWARLFTAAKASRDAATRDPEGQLIRAHSGPAPSRAIGDTFNFAELMPRGHYANRPAHRDYFSAMRYLTAAGKLAGNTDVLGQLSGTVKAKAMAWIGAYEPFIAPSRNPRVFGDSPKARPWVKHPGKEQVLFPLSWGYDNEALDSTVYHSQWPEREQIKGPAGARLTPSGLDVAAALGSQLARTLLSDEIRKYPALASALDRLSRERPPRTGTSLYDRWLDALGVQWADAALAATSENSRDVWGAKRLQTGLASWATLRHATVLVNERAEAECGEAGFEELVMRAPRGWVEQDPRTFEAIASLFDEAGRLVESSRQELKGTLPAPAYEEGKKAESLRQGLLKRLKESAGKARLFSRMAEKQIKGEPLSASDYDEILYVGRVAEHHFLVYKSLASEELALSTPDPMPKVADVAGGGAVPYLLAAVGAPLEFDFVVPFFGRRQVVKGVSYAYHEWVSDQLLDDAGWRERAEEERLVPWIEPFVSKHKLACPAKPPF
jgi:hypothetical protein